jgi:hypothetical protein
MLEEKPVVRRVLQDTYSMQQMEKMGVEMKVAPLDAQRQDSDRTEW